MPEEYIRRGPASKLDSRREKRNHAIKKRKTRKKRLKYLKTKEGA